MRYRGFQSEAPRPDFVAGQDQREPEVVARFVAVVVEQVFELLDVGQDVAGDEGDRLSRMSGHYRLQAGLDVVAETAVGVDDGEGPFGAAVGGSRTGHEDRVERAGRAQSLGKEIDQIATFDANIDALAAREGMSIAPARRQLDRFPVASSENDEGSGAHGERGRRE